MKRALLYGPLVLSLIFSLNIQAQTMSHEEEVVRNAYARFSFLCGMPPLTQAAGPQLFGVKVDELKLQDSVAQATPVFELSDFKVGPISEIANVSWRTFVTAPPPNSEVLWGGQITQSYSDNGVPSSWEMANVKWIPAPQLNPEGENFILSKTVAEIIKIGAPQWQPSSMPLVTYTRYAAFTVNVILQGKSSGPHKAIVFFGTDSKGKECAAWNDLISGPSPLDNFANNLSIGEPSGLLLGKFREAPVVANWLRANLVSDTNCAQNRRTLCCSRGHCGISSTAFNQAMSTPLPEPKN